MDRKGIEIIVSRIGIGIGGTALFEGDEKKAKRSCGHPWNEKLSPLSLNTDVTVAPGQTVP